MGHRRRRHQHRRSQPAGTGGQLRVRFGPRATDRGADLSPQVESGGTVSKPRRARHDRVVGRRLLLIAIVAVVLPYAWSPVYRFPDAAPFTGSSLYNPYAGGGGAWKRANLHAHGNAWAG